MAELGETLRVLELTCARLCHDLAGLTGTVANAIDLVPREGGPNDEIMAFARSAARALVERLRLLRAAWGPETEPLTLMAMRALTTGPLQAYRIILETGELPPACHFPPEAGRVALNVILLAAESLPKGGTIVVSGTPGDLFFQIAGPVAVWPAGLASCLNDETAAIAAITTAMTVQMPLTALLAHGRTLRLSPVLGPGGIAALRLGGT